MDISRRKLKLNDHQRENALVFSLLFFKEMYRDQFGEFAIGY